MSHMIDYVEPLNFSLTREKFYQSQVGGCKRCGEWLRPFVGSFMADAGHGFVWRVSNRSGMCKSCFEAMQSSSRYPYTKEQKKDVYYRYKTPGIDNTTHETIAYQDMEA